MAVMNSERPELLPATTRLHGLQLALARALWATLVLLTLTLFAAGLAPYRAKLSEGFAARQPLLEQLGISSQGYLGYNVALQIGFMAVFTAVGAIIFWRKSDDVLTLMVSLTLITFGAYLSEPSYLARIRPLWVVVDTVGAVSILFFTYTFPDGRLVPRWTHWAGITFFVWTFAWHLFPRAFFSPWQWPGVWEFIALLLWYGSGLAAQVYRYLHISTPTQRQQTKWVLYGLLIALAGYFISDLPSYVPALEQLTFFALLEALDSHPIYYLAMLMIPITIGISILRYRLWDVDLLINRSLVYVTVMVLLGGLYVLLLHGVMVMATRVLSADASGFAIFVATLGAVTAFTPLRRAVQRGVNRAFYRSRFDYDQLLPELITQLATNIVPERLLPLLTAEIPARLQIESASLLVLDQDELALVDARGPEEGAIAASHPLVQELRAWGRAVDLSRPGRFVVPSEVRAWLNERRVALSIPLIVEQQLVGIYNLGPKRSGIPFSRNELRLLTVLGQQAAVSVENARLYKAVASYSQGLEELVRVRTQELEGAYADLAEQHDTLNLVLHSIADGLVVTDANQRILMVNPAFARLLTPSAGELIGRPLPRVLPSPGLHAIIAKALADPTQLYSAEAPLPDGRILRASVGVLTSGQQRTGTVLVLRDVTHQHEVDRMKTEFVSMVSHELRAPLTSVLGFTKLIRKQLEQQVIAELPTGYPQIARAAKRISDNLDIIIIEGDRLTRLINNVLDISKMEAGRIEWEFDEVAVEAVIAQALQGVQALAVEIGGEVSAHVEEGLRLPRADHDRLVQVVYNLLANAIKFTDHGGIEVRAWRLNPGETLRPFGVRYPPNNGYLPAKAPLLAVTVTDNGVGIAEEELPGVFERFRQVGDPTAGTRRSGAGLGLAICREIIAHHGGDIWVESRLGEGSRFAFVLPLGPSDQPVAGS